MPCVTSRWRAVCEEAPRDARSDFRRCRYKRQMACIVAPAVCGIVGIVLINAGLLFIRRAYNDSKANPVSVPRDFEKITMAKIEKRLAVRFFNSGWCRGQAPCLTSLYVKVLRNLSGSVMFFGCFAWNGVNFMYKTSVRQGAPYVASMAIRYRPCPRCLRLLLLIKYPLPALSLLSPLWHGHRSYKSRAKSLKNRAITQWEAAKPSARRPRPCLLQPLCCLAYQSPHLCIRFA